MSDTPPCPATLPAPAGFYLNATQEPWSRNWRMYDYITQELPSLLRALPELDMARVSLMGHSMGGHGALTISLKNPTAFKSVSAFSPICNPTNVPWGQKGGPAACAPHVVPRGSHVRCSGRRSSGCPPDPLQSSAAAPGRTSRGAAGLGMVASSRACPVRLAGLHQLAAARGYSDRAAPPLCLPPPAALKGYLGDDQEAWRQYDAVALAEGYSGPRLPVLMDTGEGGTWGGGVGGTAGRAVAVPFDAG